MDSLIIPILQGSRAPSVAVVQTDVLPGTASKTCGTGSEKSHLSPSWTSQECVLRKTQNYKLNSAIEKNLSRLITLTDLDYNVDNGKVVTPKINCPIPKVLGPNYN